MLLLKKQSAQPDFPAFERLPLDKDAVVEYLKCVALFNSLKDPLHAFESLTEVLEVRKYHKHSEVITEGKSGDELFFLYEGRVSVHKQTPDGDSFKVVILDAKAHAFFGEGSILDDDPRSATIACESDVLVLALTRDAFYRFAEKNPQHAYPILLDIARAVMNRLRKTNHDFMLLYQALLAEIRGGT